MSGAVQVHSQFSHQNQDVHFEQKLAPRHLWLSLMSLIQKNTVFVKIIIKTPEKGDYSYDDTLNLDTYSVVSILEAKLGLHQESAQTEASFTITEQDETLCLEFAVSSCKNYGRLESVMSFLDKVDCPSHIDLIVKRTSPGISRIGKFAFKSHSPVKLRIPMYSRLDVISEVPNAQLIAV